MVIKPSLDRTTSVVPEHIAIVMDGNGRWAKRRWLPRVVGHRRGVEAVRAVVTRSLERGIRYLTLFAFSSENWRRPEDEVSFLMGLFISALERELKSLNANGIKIKIVGDCRFFPNRLQALITDAEQLTAENTRMTLVIAANYGGRWDILQATNKLFIERQQACLVGIDDISEHDIERHLVLNGIPDPDLFIRTSGECRISNFLLWQLAYTELYFTNQLWPDFDATSLDTAIEWFACRERRFGYTAEQIQCGQ